MKVDCLILGINELQRLEWLDQSLEFLDAQKFPFNKKVVSIYGHGHHQIPLSLRSKLESKNWIIMLTSLPRSETMINCLQNLDSDYIFYNEDDVLVRMPDPDIVNGLLNASCDGRDCGMLSLNYGGSDHDFPRGKFGDLLDIDRNILLKTDKYVAFRRDEAKKSAWFCELPAVFFRRAVLKAILLPNQGNGGLEIHMTDQYFAQGLDKQFFKVSLCRPNVFDVIEFYKHDFNMEMFETAKFMRILDSNQGDAKFDLSKIPEL